MVSVVTVRVVPKGTVTSQSTRWMVVSSQVSSAVRVPQWVVVAAATGTRVGVAVEGLSLPARSTVMTSYV